MTFFLMKMQTKRQHNEEGEKMNELLEVNYESEMPTVSARDLHKQLHIETPFKKWID